MVSKSIHKEFREVSLLMQTGKNFNRLRYSQKEGIQAKKERGEWDNYGRPAVITVEAFAKQYAKVVDSTVRPFQLMKELGMS